LTTTSEESTPPAEAASTAKVEVVRESRPPAIRSRHPPRELPKLGPADAAIFETFVVPRYLNLFGELAVEMIAESQDAQVVHVNCRTGYPDRGFALKLPGAHIYGCDPSTHAIELARAKALTMPGMVSDYRVADGFPLPLPARAFSHAYSLHPLGAPGERKVLLQEFARLLAPRGQGIIAIALRGSFPEIGDLLREYALKHESLEVAKSVEAAMLVRPTMEMFGAELEAAGFDFVDVEVRPHVLKFQSGRDFFEDPISRLLLLPELRINLALDDAEPALLYLREAIDKYWSEGTFELTLNVGCASGRRTESKDG
jgi:SAM-dependent methyltransferase